MKVKVCTGDSCKNRFSEYIVERLENDIEFNNFDNLEVEKCTCLWNCYKWPSILIDWKIEEKISPSKASELVMNKINWKKPKKTRK